MPWNRNNPVISLSIVVKMDFFATFAVEKFLDLWDSLYNSQSSPSVDNFNNRIGTESGFKVVRFDRNFRKETFFKSFAMSNKPTKNLMERQKMLAQFVSLWTVESNLRSIIAEVERFTVAKVSPPR